MPTLYSRGVATQASVADLARTTATSSAEIDQAFNEGADTGTLWETAIPCHDSRDDDTGMHFIGDYQSIPFHTVHAGKQFFNIQCEVRRSLRPRRIPDAFKRKVITSFAFHCFEAASLGNWALIMNTAVRRFRVW